MIKTDLLNASSIRSSVNESAKVLRNDNYSKTERGIELNPENKAFLSIFSHNVKNPFGALLGYSDLLLEDFNEIPDIEKQQYLEQIKCSANLTYKYIERFFEWMYYKLDKVRTEFEYLNIREIVSIAVEKLLMKGDFLGEVLFEIESDTLIYADKESSVKIFYYILENAMNYSKPNGKIVINSIMVNGLVEIEVKDYGIGISEDRMKKLFDISQNMVSCETGMENMTGLGLILTHQLVKINNGIIKISSKKNVGTSVCVTFRNDCFN